MESMSRAALRIEFEARMFISFTLVAVVCFASFTVFEPTDTAIVLAAQPLGFRPGQVQTGMHVFAAMIMLAASLLRMWGGSVLSSVRMMAFKVQTDTLVTSGPYRFVRNPIYSADLLAMTAFALCLPPPGLLLPLLFFFHYNRLARFEEQSLERAFGEEYKEYRRSTPRLLPSATLQGFMGGLKEFRVTWDGFRNNALYLLFIPGLLVAAWTGEFSHAVLIGFPAVIEWAWVHTRKGIGHRNNETSKRVFEDILYAQCWEDPSLDRAAFGLGKDDVVLTITSGGCNALTFLLDDPQEIIALDLNPSQNHLLALKIAAFRHLTHDELLEFVGVRPSDRRLDLYRKLRHDLDGNSRDYWEKQASKIREGIIHSGRFERYMRLLRFWLRLFIGRNTMEAFFAARDRKERDELYRTQWENILWVLFTRVLLSRSMMTLLFDKAFFAQLDARLSFGANFAAKTRRALTELPVQENYFLSYILLGRYFSERHLPPFLLKENFEVIRSRVERITIVTEKCDRYLSRMPGNTISRFNFTNIFEWMSPADCEAILRETVRVAKPGAILTYRNLLVPRSRPETLAHEIEPLEDLANALFERDLSFIYDRYVVERVRKEERP
ncbi:MAG: DUF3419 family protein [Ignavibacterium sp.]|jgi:S-adenosylmethionine-diacylglycerol 3-amino-3-carboxypropyl transferase